MSYSLTTKTRVKSRLDIVESTQHDTLIDNLILAVTDRMERFCNRRFMQATHTNELHDGSDPNYRTYRTTLILKNAPVHSISSIQYNAGTNSDPDWTAFDADTYDVDLQSGLIYFDRALPTGRRNIRVTYVAGYTGFSIGINNYWVYNAVPTGAVNGSNLTFTIPVNASQIIVYADGGREAASNIVFTANTSTFSFVAGRAPYTTLYVDYLPTSVTPDTEDDVALPSDLVEICEEVVVRIFNRRLTEGRQTETLGEATVTYVDSHFSKENLAALKNYRRGYAL